MDDINAAADDAEDALAEIAAIIASGPTGTQQLTNLYIDFNARHDVALGLVDDLASCGRDCPNGGTILAGALDDYEEAKQDVLDLWVSQGTYGDEFCCLSMDDDVCSGYPIDPLGVCTDGSKYICAAPGSSPDGGIFCGDDWEEY